MKSNRDEGMRRELMGCVNNKEFFQFLTFEFICQSIRGNILPVLFLLLFHGSKSKRMFTKIKEIFHAISYLINLHTLHFNKKRFCIRSVISFCFVLWLGRIFFFGFLVGLQQKRTMEGMTFGEVTHDDRNE